MAGCLECGEYITNPYEWVCDKCTEKLLAPWTKLSEEEKIKYLKSNGVKDKDIEKYL